jgi:hypothetical protein
MLFELRCMTVCRLYGDVSSYVMTSTNFVPTGKQADDSRLLVVGGWGHPWSRMAECKKIFEVIRLRHNSGRFRNVMHRGGTTRTPSPLPPPMTMYENEVV